MNTIAMSFALVALTSPAFADSGGSRPSPPGARADVQAHVPADTAKADAKMHGHGVPSWPDLNSVTGAGGAVAQKAGHSSAAMGVSATVLDDTGPGDGQ